MFLLMLLLIAGLLIGLVFMFRKQLEKCMNCHPRVKEAYHLVKQKLMFNSMIRTMLQMYLLTAISTLINAVNYSRHGPMPGLNMLLMIVMIAGLLAVPFLAYRHLKKNEHKLRTPDFKGSYGSLY